MTTCPTCGSQVTVHTGDEGTSSYTPADTAPTCSKCRNADLAVSFHKGSGYYDGCGGSVKRRHSSQDGEHLHYTCHPLLASVVFGRFVWTWVTDPSCDENPSDGIRCGQCESCLEVGRRIEQGHSRGES